MVNGIFPRDDRIGLISNPVVVMFEDVQNEGRVVYNEGRQSRPVVGIAVAALSCMAKRHRIYHGALSHAVNYTIIVS